MSHHPQALTGSTGPLQRSHLSGQKRVPPPHAAVPPACPHHLGHPERAEGDRGIGGQPTGCPGRAGAGNPMSCLARGRLGQAGG